MHEIYIDTWLKQMLYWGTKADELPIYALSDMLNVHSFIVTNDRLFDTMDKVVAHEDVSFTDPNYWLKFRDCMDLVTGRVCDLVEIVNFDNLCVLDEI